MHAIDGFVGQGSVDLQREPSMVTTSEKIALRTRLAALAFGGACQLLQCAVKFFTLPTERVRNLRDLRERGLIWIIGDAPVNVEVSGNYLEQSHFERHFLELDSDAMLEPFVGPIDRIKMDVALCCAQTDQAIGFASGEKVNPRR